jgi:hypothetical protein
VFALTIRNRASTVENSPSSRRGQTRPCFPLLTDQHYHQQPTITISSKENHQSATCIAVGQSSNFYTTRTSSSCHLDTASLEHSAVETPLALFFFSSAAPERH